MKDPLDNMKRNKLRRHGIKPTIVIAMEMAIKEPLVGGSGAAP